MKIILTLLMILSFLNADEMKRIEAIVADIQELRSDYEKCQKKLHNGVFVQTNSNEYEELYNKEKKNNKLLSKKILKLEKQLLIENNLLKTKDKTINKLSKNTKNIFPKLIMKKKYEKIFTFKASSFHLIHDSIIYDSINGVKLDVWMKNTSFTSSIKTKSWIKITGYFINKKWKSAKKEMWIKIAQVEKK